MDSVVPIYSSRRAQAALMEWEATRQRIDGLQAALKAVLGESVSQQGSLVTPDRLRFDFSLPRGVEPAELAAVEALVNSWIVADETLTTAVMPLADAKAAGAVAMFGEKYDAAGVRVVRVPGAGAELCGGTHVATTGRIGGFKIVSEAGVASGVRRVEAVVGPALVEYLNSVDAVVRSLSSSLSAKPDDLPARVAALQDDLKAAQREAAALRVTSPAPHAALGLVQGWCQTILTTKPLRANLLKATIRKQPFKTMFNKLLGSHARELT